MNKKQRFLNYLSGDHTGWVGYAFDGLNQFLIDSCGGNEEVIRMATLGNAEIFGLDRELGSIEPGKKADLIVLNKDPLKDIANTKSILLVLKDGKIVRDDLLGI